jgi:moderate conductance mechanosensitive channel
MENFDWANPWPSVLAFLLDVPLAIVITIAVALVVRGVILLVIRRVVNQIVSGVKKRQKVDDTQALQASPLAAVRTVQRTRTIGTVLTNVTNAAVIIVLAIALVNIIAPGAAGAFSLITAALGAGLGFGAQNIVKDVLNGLFIVIEDQLGVGDVVDTGFATGVVESVGIRVTQVRDVNGVLWYVRNGEMLRIGNMSQGWSRVIVDLGVPYDADVDEVEERLLDTAVAMSKEAKWQRLVLEKPEIWGIESISAEAVVVRLVVKTRSGSKDDVARELRGRLKATLDGMGLRLPALNQVVLSGFESAASVKGARPPRTEPLPKQPANPTVTTEDDARKPRRSPRSSD